jgi:hypothetical protein
MAEPRNQGSGIWSIADSEIGENSNKLFLLVSFCKSKSKIKFQRKLNQPGIVAGASLDPANCGYIFHNSRFNAPGADPDLIENIVVRGFIESPEYRHRFPP